ncbi:MAG: hypothetical protein LJU34_01595, partial [Oscillospiraceae bacterium]|nr:hypothetical protein [Oscillospiraceae bacterium]
VKPGQRIAALILTVLALLFCLPTAAGAVSLADYEAGTYELDASLSCYVNAMGGVEFGGPLLTGTTLTVEEDGSAFVTLYLTKSSVTIYSVTCDTFVDADPSYVTDDRGVTNGTIGYYDQEGNLITEGVTYTLSDDTALNPSDEEVNYVDSITFPLTYESDTYALTMYINSNVMGVQFCEENDEAESTTYPAALTIYWDGYAETEEDTEAVEVTGEEMDGLTIYRAEDEEAEEASEDESTSEAETATEAASGGEETVAQSAVFGNVSQGLLIVLLVIGVLLILLGAASLTVNILGTKRKKEDGGHDA